MSIVLTVASIVQGLALVQLANTLGTLDTPVEWLFFLLAFVVVVRVFQTYVLAALEYDDWQVNVWDIMLVFVLGLVQYQFIRTLAVQPTFDPAAYEVWFAVLAGAALVGYGRAYWKIRTHCSLEPSVKRAESNLQLLNLLGSAMCLLYTTPVLFLKPSSLPVLVLVPTVQASVVVANTYWSVRETLWKPRVARLIPLTTRPNGKYEPLRRHLSDMTSESTSLAFEEIEAILGKSLPPSAARRSSWWKNDLRHPQAAAWMNAGCLVESVSLETAEVVFAQSDSAEDEERGG